MQPLSRLLSKVERVPFGGCWIFMGAGGGSGYGHFYHDGRLDSAHRASWKLHNGPIPDGQQVLHRCDVKSCCNPHHLFLGSQQENMDDMGAKGRRSTTPAAGARNANSKLTEASVAMIRASSSPTQQLANELLVTYQTVWQIRRGLKWRADGSAPAAN